MTTAAASWQVGADDQFAGLVPIALSFLDSFLSKIQLSSSLPLLSWCCRDRLHLIVVAMSSPSIADAFWAAPPIAR